MVIFILMYEFSEFGGWLSFCGDWVLGFRGDRREVLLLYDRTTVGHE